MFGKLVDKKFVEHSYVAEHPNVSFPATVTLDDLQNLDSTWIECIVMDKPIPKSVLSTITQLDPVLNKATKTYSVDWRTVERLISELSVDELNALKQSFSGAAKSYMDTAAKARGWDDIKSAALRAAFDGPYKSEGVIYAQWMDTVWAKFYELEDAIVSGNAPLVTPSELVMGLPAPPTFGDA